MNLCKGSQESIIYMSILSSPVQLQRRQGPQSEGEARLYNEVGGSETSEW